MIDFINSNLFAAMTAAFSMVGAVATLWLAILVAIKKDRDE